MKIKDNISITEIGSTIITIEIKDSLQGLDVTYSQQHEKRKKIGVYLSLLKPTISMTFAILHVENPSPVLIKLFQKQ